MLVGGTQLAGESEDAEEGDDEYSCLLMLSGWAPNAVAPPQGATLYADSPRFVEVRDVSITHAMGKVWSNMLYQYLCSINRTLKDVRCWRPMRCSCRLVSSLPFRVDVSSGEQHAASVWSVPARRCSAAVGRARALPPQGS